VTKDDLGDIKDDSSGLKNSTFVCNKSSGTKALMIVIPFEKFVESSRML